MLQTGAIVLAGMAVALSGAALTHPTTSDSACLLQRHCHLSRLQLDIVNTALESRMQGQIVWQGIEVGYFVATQIEDGQDIHAANRSWRATRNIELSVHRKPGLPSNASHFDFVGDSRSIQPEVYGFLGENATRSCSQIPGEHYVALDEAHGQVVALLIVIAGLTQEGQ